MALIIIWKLEKVKMENGKIKTTGYSNLGDGNKKRLSHAFEGAIILCLVALFILGLFIAVINDIYAFVKPDKAIKITLGKPVSLMQAANILERSGVIENPVIFTLYVKVKGKEEIFDSYLAEAELNSAMSYREILSALEKMVN